MWRVYMHARMLATCVFVSVCLYLYLCDCVCGYVSCVCVYMSECLLGMCMRVYLSVVVCVWECVSNLFERKF